jgi:hypothetical protein
VRADSDVTRPVYYRDASEAPPLGQRPSAVKRATSPPHGVPLAVGGWFARMDARIRNLQRALPCVE